MNGFLKMAVTGRDSTPFSDTPKVSHIFIWFIILYIQLSLALYIYISIAIDIPLNPLFLSQTHRETPFKSVLEARDAKYVADGGFCGTPDMNGSRRSASRLSGLESNPQLPRFDASEMLRTSFSPLKWLGDPEFLEPHSRILESSFSGL